MSTTKRMRAQAPAVRALASCRVSTAGQGADGFGMAAQGRAVTAGVNRRGWQLVILDPDIDLVTPFGGRWPG